MRNRKRIFIDKEVQGAVVRRILYYWAACMLFLTIPLLISKTLAESEKYFYEHLTTLLYAYWPVYVIAVLLLPFVIFDFLRVSHTFAGPIHHLRRELSSFLKGNKIKEISFRESDHWHDLADIVNQVIAKVNENESTEITATCDRTKESEIDQSIVETTRVGERSL